MGLDGCPTFPLRFGDAFARSGAQLAAFAACNRDLWEHDGGAAVEQGPKFHQFEVNVTPLFLEPEDGSLDNLRSHFLMCHFCLASFDRSFQ